MHPRHGCLPSAHPSLAALVFLLVAVSIAAAQNGPDDVPFASRDSQAPGATKPLQVDVNLVLVPVLVIDRDNRLLTGLHKDDFEILEDGKKQEIKYFYSDDTPISVGIVFDRSGSMNHKLMKARQAVDKFLDAGHPGDEFFVVTVSDEPELLSSFTTVVKRVKDKLTYTPAMGYTALLDAIDVAVAQMRQARNLRRCLFIVSDGGDNHSRDTEAAVRALVREADIQIYSMGVYDNHPSREEEWRGPGLLQKFSQLTGGRSIQVEKADDLMATAMTVARELHSQYVLGYKATGIGHRGDWHELKVKLAPAASRPELRVHAKDGYFDRR
jgi:Ca-activated chloride channel homolog